MKIKSSVTGYWNTFFAKKQNQLTGIKVCDIDYISRPVLLVLHFSLKVSLLLKFTQDEAYRMVWKITQQLDSDNYT